MIADAGATVHFDMQGAPVINIKPTTNSIGITLSNRQSIMPTHTCNLNIPWLPAFVTEAYIVPGMAYSSLISIKKCCNGRCKIIYNETEVRVMDKGIVFLSGGRDTSTGLRLLPNCREGHQPTGEEHGVHRARFKNATNACCRQRQPHGDRIGVHTAV